MGQLYGQFMMDAAISISNDGDGTGEFRRVALIWSAQVLPGAGNMNFCDEHAVSIDVSLIGNRTCIKS